MHNNKIRHFNVTVLSIPIVYDFFGDYDPNGLMYILKEDKEFVRKKALKNFNNLDEYCDPLPIPTDEVQPLTIRANLGDTIIIEFEHNEDRRLSLHMQGLKYKNIKSDGANVGFNKDSTVGPGEKITYEYFADTEGIFYFSDLGDARSSEDATNVHGLFGALIVEAEGSTWTDPVTGCELRSGLFADVHNPNKPSFREYGVFFHDELEIKNRFGGPLIGPFTQMEMGATAISYRSEPMINRDRFPIPKDKDFQCCDFPGSAAVKECGNVNPQSIRRCTNGERLVGEFGQIIMDGEDVSMSSWPFGDPATFIPRAYIGDPSKFRFINGGIFETHIFHLHGHQWLLEPDDPKSTIIDSISTSPQESYTIDIIDGAGSTVGALGDYIWHCHLYPHFHEGMWSLWRVFDRLETGECVVLEDGTVIEPCYPDGTLIEALMPLPDRKAPPEKDADHPGFPNFINGEFGERALQPPLGILNADGTNKLCPTPLEEANFADNFSPGALYTQPCPDDCCDLKANETEPPKPDVVFELFALQARLIYNNSCWNDPQGRFYVTKQQIEDFTCTKLTLKNRERLAKEFVAGVENGEIDIEPLVIRANAGDCIEVRTTNFLPEILEGSVFQIDTITDNIGFHIHLVKFDVVASDGGANGYNNTSSAFYGETLIERYFANVELNACFFHDHFYPNSHQQHGLFAALIIEPKGSTYHDPFTGEPITQGTQAVIRTPSGRAFREFGLFVHDFTLLFDGNGKPLNPPPFPESHDDPGVMAINYKSEPLGERLCSCDDDPAYVYSSLVHGDPVTPILETYPGEEIIIRLLDGAQEEQHAFNINGLKWRKEITDPKSPLVQAQVIGISEAFNIRITDDYKAGDYIYYFGGQDDLWLGLWGIIRSHKCINDRLIPLDEFKSKCNCQDTPEYKYKNIKEFHIAAIQKDLIYNKFKDHDPNGLLFVPFEHKDDVLSGKIEPIPLILRANKGDLIKVTLTNLFKEQIPYFAFPGVPIDKVIVPSMRVGITPQFLQFDPVNDSGVNVGFNDVEQTVGPGESITYTWFADQEYGTCLISSITDIRNQRYHGLFGAIIIEPEGARVSSDYYKVDYKAKYREQVIIKTPNDEFKELVLFMHNGIRLLDACGNIIETLREAPADDGGHGGHEAVDFEDRGEKGFNYKSERFFNRLQDNPDISKVFSSKTHGDPATPVFNVLPGEKVIIRLIMPADKPRNTCFVLHGHKWMAQPDDPFTRIISAQGAMNIGNVFNINLLNGASLIPGDYMYRSGLIKGDIEGGMWGIIRIRD